MKLFSIFRKSQISFLLFAGIIFVILRFPSLFEPYWYGDEGIYFVIGDALRDGRILYSEIWDNKPPLLYLFYQFFGQSIFGIRFVSMIFGIGALISFYHLVKILFKPAYYAVLASLLFIFFLGTPIIEGNIANAENFMIFPVILGFLIFFRNIYNKTLNSDNKNNEDQTRTYIVIGLCFGIAFLFKIVGIFDFFTLLFFVFILKFKDVRINIFQSLFVFIKSFRKIYMPLLIGFVAPTLIYGMSTIFQGNFLEFIQSAYFENVNYVSFENDFFIPHGFLIIKTVILGILLFAIYRLKDKLSSEFLFICIWFVFSLYSIYFSQRPYAHYVLLLVPSMILLILSLKYFKKHSIQILLAVVINVIIVASTFNFFLLPKTFSYYFNFTSYVFGVKNIDNYISFFDHNSVRDYVIASFIKSLPAEKKVYVWGDSAQIYFMSDKIPASKYVVSYHITNDVAKKEVEESLTQTPPDMVFVLPNTALVPFSLKTYNYRATIEGVDIYERF